MSFHPTSQHRNIATLQHCTISMARNLGAFHLHVEMEQSELRIDVILASRFRILQRVADPLPQWLCMSWHHSWHHSWLHRSWSWIDCKTRAFRSCLLQSDIRFVELNVLCKLQRSSFLTSQSCVLEDSASTSRSNCSPKWSKPISIFFSRL